MTELFHGNEGNVSSVRIARGYASYEYHNIELSLIYNIKKGPLPESISESKNTSSQAIRKSKRKIKRKFSKDFVY